MNTNSNDAIRGSKISSASINIERIKKKKLNEDVGSAQSYLTSKFTQESLNVNESATRKKSLPQSKSTLKGAESSVNNNVINHNSSVIIETKEEKMVHLFDQFLINKIVLTKSTFKYGFIMVSTILLMCFLLFVFILGAVNIYNCPSSPNIPVYLLIIGFMSSLRIILFYTCPFSYSKSVGGKIYENVIESLVVDRFRVSNKASKEYALSHYDYSGSFLVKFKLKSMRLISFLLNFCCCCCCFSCLYHDKSICSCLRSKNKSNKTSQNKGTFEINTSQPSLASPSSTYLTANESQEFSPSMSVTKSYSNISTKTNSSNISNLFNGLLFYNSRCFDCSPRRKKKLRQNSQSISQFSSRQSSFKSKDVHPKIKNKLNKSLRFSMPKTKYTYSKRINVNQRSKHNSGYHYTSHKHIKRHYKKQGPHHLIDVRSIRYGIMHFLQRCIDIFIIVWFICGNYWVLKIFDKMSDQFLLKRLTISVKNHFKVDEKWSNTVKMDSLNSTRLANNTISYVCDELTYKTAFLQIISSYTIFLIFVIFVISYRIYLITCHKKHRSHRRKSLKNRKS